MLKQENMKLLTIRVLLFSLIAIALGAIKPVETALAQTPPPATGICIIMHSSFCVGKVTTLKITLPPTSLFTPKQLQIGSQLYNFSNGNFTPTSQGKLTVTTTPVGTGLYTSYQVTVTGFQKGNIIGYLPQSSNKIAQLLGTAKAQTPPPALGGMCFVMQAACNGTGGITIKLTFNQPNLTAAQALAKDIQVNGATTSLSLAPVSSCQNPGNSGPYLCMDTSISFVTPEVTSLAVQHLLQSVQVSPPGITLNGNTASGGNSSNFTFKNSNSVAVGGAVTLSNGQQLNNYESLVKTLQWSSVQPQLTSIFTSGKSNGSSVTASTLSTANWYLNSSANTPAINSPSTFSSPPEGKLWNVTNLTSGALTVNVPGSLTIAGRGTLTVDGNVVITGTGTITCQPGSNFGILANGSITFGSGITTIGCGAFTALNGDITFQANLSNPILPWKGIFLASGSVHLPKVSAGTQEIDYDTDFAGNPTILYTSVLNLVFLSTN